MTDSTTWTGSESRARLRAADPAESGLDTELWPSVTARAALARIVAEPGPAGAAGSAHPPSARRGFGRRLLPVAAVLVVVVVAAGVALLRTTGGGGEPHRSAASTGASRVPTAAQGSDAADKTAALAAVEKVLAGVPALPGARSAPDDRRAGAVLSQPGNDNLVERSAYWTAPGTVDAAIAYLRAHLPDGWTIGGTSSSGQVGRGTTAEGLTLDVSNPSSPGMYTQLQVQVGVAPYHGGVAMIAQAQAIWLPARTAAEQIPATATFVDVTITRPSRDTVRRTLTGAALRQLAEVVNAQPIATPVGTTSCPIAIGRSDDTLAFHAPGTTITVTAWHNGCSGVTVSADGKAQPDLDGVDGIDAAVIDLLDLPGAYRIN